MKADDTMMKAEMHNSVQRQHHAEPLAMLKINMLIMLSMLLMMIYVNYVDYINYVNYVDLIYVNYVDLC